MELSIIILNYNTPLHTINCLKSLCQQHKKELKKDEYEIILVDNKSTDDSVSKIEKEIRRRKWKLSFIKSNKNAGFGSGCNMGAKRSKGKYVLFLNSDTIVQDQSIRKMLEFMNRHKNVSILGGGLLNENGTRQAGCGVFPNFYHSLMILLGLGKDILVRTPEKISQVNWVTGGCMIVNKNVFDELGGFDENIFMYLEDLEICYRACRNNYNTFYYPFSKIIHLRGKSSNPNFVISNTYKGYLYFCNQHKNKLEYFFVNSLFSIKFKMYYIIGKTSNNVDLVHIRIFRFHHF